MKFLRPTQPAPQFRKQTTDCLTPISARAIQNSAASSQTSSLTPSQVMQLQHQRGNQFVLGLLRPQAARLLQRAPASALDEQATQTERKEIKVLTREDVPGFSADDLKDIFLKDKSKPSMFDDVHFDANIKEPMKSGLQTIAIGIYGKQAFHENTTTNLPLDLTPFGGVNGVYRFTLVVKKATSKDRLIIEQVSTKPPTQLNKQTIIDQEARLNQFDLKIGTGFSGGSSREQLLAALAHVPDNLLEQVRGVTFSISNMNAAGPTGEHGHYDPNTRSIEMFADALNTVHNSVDAAGTPRFIFAIIHELGHATDFERRNTLQRKVTDLTRQLRDAELAAKQVSVDLNAPIGENDDKAGEKKRIEQDKVRQLKRDLNDAQSALARATQHSDSSEFKNAQGNAISNYGATAPVENYAELYSMFVLDPDLLKSIRPEAFRYFTSLF